MPGIMGTRGSTMHSPNICMRFKNFFAYFKYDMQGVVIYMSHDQWVREIEHGPFSPLVFSGGMGTTATVVYKQRMILEKHEKPYSKTMQWIRCRLSFSLLRFAMMCFCGSWSSRHHPDHHPIDGGSIDLLNGQGPKPGLNCSPYIGTVCCLTGYFCLMFTFVSWTFNSFNIKANHCLEKYTHWNLHGCNT